MNRTCPNNLLRLPIDIGYSVMGKIPWTPASEFKSHIAGFEVLHNWLHLDHFKSSTQFENRAELTLQLTEAKKREREMRLKYEEGFQISKELSRFVKYLLVGLFAIFFFPYLLCSTMKLLAKSLARGVVGGVGSRVHKSSDRGPLPPCPVHPLGLRTRNHSTVSTFEPLSTEKSVDNLFLFKLEKGISANSADKVTESSVLPMTEMDGIERKVKQEIRDYGFDVAESDFPPPTQLDSIFESIIKKEPVD